jgi:hypothetical protein
LELHGCVGYNEIMQNDPSKPDKKEADKEPAKDNWAEDQKERGYYYDDAHGYEQFDPESEEESECEGELDSSQDD